MLAARAEASPRAAGIVELNVDGTVAARVPARDLIRLGGARSAAMVRTLPRDASIVVSLPSGVDLAVWMIAAVGAGMRVVALHPSSTAVEVRRAAQAAGASVVVRGEHFCDGDLNARPELGRALLDSGAVVGGPWPGERRGGIALSSSGSTGMPKLALRGAAALDADARAVAAGLGLCDRDAVLCIPPLCHSYGLDLLLGAMWSGAELRIMPEFTAAGAARAIAEGITVLPATPFVFESLARVAPGEARPRLAVSAGSSLSPRVREEFERMWGVPIGQLYGATELGTVAVHRPDEAGFDPGCIGGPLEGVSFRLVGGEIPELLVRAPSMLSAYLDAELRLEDGHFRTGDLARLDARGRVYITGRCKHLIDAGGFKVNPLEVEAAIMEHPAIRECAAAPLWLSDTVCKVRALIVVRAGADAPGPGELRAFLKDRLAPAKLPRVFEVVDALPRSPLGKLLRDRLPGGPC